MSNLISHINDNSRPLIFLGSNAVMEKYTDVCHELGIDIHGCIDSDYYGNREKICGIPIIDTEKVFDSPQGLAQYRNYNFFCATNWSPEHNSATTRNRLKRQNLIDLLDSLELSVISLVDPTAKINSTAKIGRGCFVDCMAMLEAHVVLEDYVNIYSHSCIGHHTQIDRNSVIQRQCSIAGAAHFETNCFLGVSVKALKTGATFGRDTFIHECMYVRRGTVPGEVIGINGANMSRVYSEQDRHAG
jgi:carbonic anhydrase/acetyltransferase-like protein (isoleucine patch superfamily)